MKYELMSQFFFLFFLNLLMTVYVMALYYLCRFLLLLSCAYSIICCAYFNLVMLLLLTSTMQLTIEGKVILRCCHFLLCKKEQLRASSFRQQKRLSRAVLDAQQFCQSPKIRFGFVKCLIGFVLYLLLVTLCLLLLTRNT